MLFVFFVKGICSGLVMSGSYLFTVYAEFCDLQVKMSENVRFMYFGGKNENIAKFERIKLCPFLELNGYRNGGSQV